MKKVLIIAYFFPPIGGGGVQRALKMAKYLGEFGWEVHVLTVEPSHHVSLDESLLAQLPDEVQIHRCKTLLPSTRKPNTASTTGIKVTTNASSMPNNNLVSRIKKKAFTLLKKAKQTLLVPDDQILWVPFAMRKGLEIINKHQIDVILSTSGPNSNHLVGLYLKRKTNKQWIADFRDPWTQNMHRTNMEWREWLEEKLERIVLKESDCLLTVTQSFADNFAKKFHKEITKTEVIHNGFDREDYIELNHSNHNTRCTFIYTGIFYKERNPRMLLKAVKILIDEKTIPRDRIHFQFAGVFDYPGYSENQACVDQLEINDLVEVMGHLPHQKVLQAMNKANVLMLVGDSHPESGNYIPGKLYEYMAIGHPILALSLPGESTEIIKQYQLGEIADPSSLEQTKQALLTLYKQWDNKQHLQQQDQQQNQQQDQQQDQQTRNNDTTSQLAVPPMPSTLIYERREQARMLAELMDELISPHNY